MQFFAVENCHVGNIKSDLTLSLTLVPLTIGAEGDLEPAATALKAGINSNSTRLASTILF